MALYTFQKMYMPITSGAARYALKNLSRSGEPPIGLTRPHQSLLARKEGEGRNTYVQRRVELRKQAHHVQHQPRPAAPRPHQRPERQLAHIPALHAPRVAEAQVGGAHAAPDEEVGQPGQRQQPVEHGGARGGLVDEGEEAEEDLEDHGGQGAAALVDVGETGRRHAVGGQRLEGAGAAEGGRVGDGEHGDADDGVHDGGQGADAREADGDDEGAVGRVGARGVEQVRVVRRHDQAQDEGVDNVEEEDAPEDLLGRFGQRLARVGGLGGGQADELGPAESEGCRHEDGAEAVEAVAEGAWVVPVAGADVAAVVGGHAAAVDDDAEDDEAQAGGYLDDSEDELDCCIVTGALEKRASSCAYPLRIP